MWKIGELTLFWALCQFNVYCLFLIKGYAIIIQDYLFFVGRKLTKCDPSASIWNVHLVLTVAFLLNFLDTFKYVSYISIGTDIKYVIIITFVEWKYHNCVMFLIRLRLADIEIIFELYNI